MLYHVLFFTYDFICWVGGGGGGLIFNTGVSKKGGLDKKEVEKNRGCNPERNYDLLL